MIVKTQSTKSIAEASQEALRVIADAASIATRAIAVAAAEAVKVKDAQNSTDHDAIVELKILMISLKEDIRDLADGTKQRITLLENGKLDNKSSYFVLYKVGVDENLKDHNQRIKEVENKLNIWLGALLVLQVILGVVLWYFGKK